MAIFNDPKSVRKLRRIAEKLAECALNGEPWAISQVADRIDGKVTAEIQTEQMHRYVVEMPPELTREQWIQKYCTADYTVPGGPGGAVDVETDASGASPVFLEKDLHHK